jgi:hypothetical protein
VLVVDGKTLRGARGSDGRPAKLVCVYDHAHRLVLTQTGVVDGDEIAAFTAALSTLPDRNCSGSCRNPDVSAGEFGENVEGSAAVFCRGR